MSLNGSSSSKRKNQRKKQQRAQQAFQPQSSSSTVPVQTKIINLNSPTAADEIREVSLSTGLESLAIFIENSKKIEEIIRAFVLAARTHQSDLRAKQVTECLYQHAETMLTQFSVFSNALSTYLTIIHPVPYERMKQRLQQATPEMIGRVNTDCEKLLMLGYEKVNVIDAFIDKLYALIDPSDQHNISIRKDMIVNLFTDLVPSTQQLIYRLMTCNLSKLEYVATFERIHEKSRLFSKHILEYQQILAENPPTIDQAAFNSSLLDIYKSILTFLQLSGDELLAVELKSNALAFAATQKDLLGALKEDIKLVDAIHKLETSIDEKIHLIEHSDFSEHRQRSSYQLFMVLYQFYQHDWQNKQSSTSDTQEPKPLTLEYLQSCSKTLKATQIHDIRFQMAFRNALMCLGHYHAFLQDIHYIEHFKSFYELTLILLSKLLPVMNDTKVFHDKLIMEIISLVNQRVKDDFLKLKELEKLRQDTTSVSCSSSLAQSSSLNSKSPFIQGTKSDLLKAFSEDILPDDETDMLADLLAEQIMKSFESLSISENKNQSTSSKSPESSALTELNSLTALEALSTPAIKSLKSNQQLEETALIIHQQSKIEEQAADIQDAQKALLKALQQQHAERIQALEQQYQKELEQSKLKLEGEFDAEKKLLQAQHQSEHQTKKQQLTNKNKRAIAKLKKQQSAEIERIRAAHQKSLSSLQSQSDRELTTTLAESRSAFEAQKNTLNSELKQQLNVYRTSLEEKRKVKLASLDSEHRQKLSSIKQAHKASIETITTKHQSQIVQIQELHQSEMEQLKSKLASELENITKEHAIAIAALESTHAAHRATQLEEHMAVKAAKASELAKQFEQAKQPSDPDKPLPIKLLVPAEYKCILRPLQKAGVPVHICGGWVRNRLLNIPATLQEDIDVIVQADAETVMSVLGEDCFQNPLQPRQIKIGRLDIWCDPAPDLHAALKERDFTINTFTCDLEGWVYDRLGYFEHLSSPCLHVIDDNTCARFKKDPSLILRLLRFSNALNKAITENDWAVVCALQHTIKSIPYGIYLKNIEYMFASSHGIQTFRFLVQNEMLSCVFPFLTKEDSEYLHQNKTLYEFIEQTLYQYGQNPDAYQAGHMIALMMLIPIVQKYGINSTDVAFLVDEHFQTSFSEYSFEDAPPVDQLKIRRFVSSLLCDQALPVSPSHSCSSSQQSFTALPGLFTTYKTFEIQQFCHEQPRTLTNQYERYRHSKQHSNGKSASSTDVKQPDSKKASPGYKKTAKK